jgi:hypothetical protein
MYAGANTRISCYAASDRTACAAFFAESRMQLGNATSLDRKSGDMGHPSRTLEAVNAANLLAGALRVSVSGGTAEAVPFVHVPFHM